MSETLLRLSRLHQELARVNEACRTASLRHQPGSLFYLLRKKWKLTQEIFEAESAVQLLSERSASRAE